MNDLFDEVPVFSRFIIFSLLCHFSQYFTSQIIAFPAHSMILRALVNRVHLPVQKPETLSGCNSQKLGPISSLPLPTSSYKFL